VGQDLEQVAQGAVNDRVRIEQFDAAAEANAAEYSFGTALDTHRGELKGKIAATSGDDPTKVAGAIDTAVSKYATNVEKDRQETMAALKSPLAKRNFDMRTQFYTRSAAKASAGWKEARLKEWNTENVQGIAKRALRESGNVTATDSTPEKVKDDLENFALHISTGVLPVRMDLIANGIAPAKADEAEDQLLADGAKNAVLGYAHNPVAGLEFLESEVPGMGGVKIYNREDPTKSLLTGKEGEELKTKLLGNKRAKVAGALAEQWRQLGLPNKAGFDASIRDEVKAGRIDYQDAGEVRRQYTAGASEDHTRTQIADANTENYYVDMIGKKYGGNVAKAMLDPAFQKTWLGVPTHIQTEVEKKLAQNVKEDPAALGRYLDFLTGTRVPGWSDAVHPAVLEQTINGLGPYTKEATALVKQDKQDKEKEPYVGAYKDAWEFQLDPKLREVVDYPLNTLVNPDSKLWSAARKPTQQDAAYFATTTLKAKLSAIAKSIANDPKLQLKATDLVKEAVDSTLKDTRERFQRAEKIRERDYGMLSGQIWSAPDAPRTTVAAPPPAPGTIVNIKGISYKVNDDGSMSRVQ